MSPIEAAILRRKLEHIVTCLDNLRPIARMTPEDYADQDHFIERKASERMLQEARSRVCSSNLRCIDGLPGSRRFHEDPLPYGGFLMVGRLGVIPGELALELAPSAGLRNRLVHEYEAIDDAKVFAAIGTILRLYPRYVNAVEEYIEKQGL